MLTLKAVNDVNVFDGSTNAQNTNTAVAATIEYGEAVVEIHEDALLAGERVLLVDDLLATGGTAEAGIRLIERLGAEVIGCAFVVDLPDLGGRKKLEALGMEVHCLCAFEGH